MSQLKKILVAYDGSPHSKKALNWAIDLSLMSAAEVVVVKVFEGNELYAMAEAGVASLLALFDAMRREKQKLMDELHQRLMDEVSEVAQKRGVKLAGEILQGNIAGEIISYAEKNKFDLIIAGTKGQGVLENLLMGSVSRNLVSLSHVPVMVVKD